MTRGLNDLGWTEHFARQLSEADAPHRPSRVVEIHRDRIVAILPEGSISLHPRDASGAHAVGDWILTDGVSVLRRLTPYSDLARRAAGPGVARQRIAANLDTIGIVTSCNEDFNIPRLERYLAMVTSSGSLPLIILTKADLADRPEDYLRQARRLSPLVTAISVNARDPEDTARLTPWCSNAQTLALVGSSGVGKTTLRNALTGEDAPTQDIRIDDARGRHTTTFRTLRPTLAGGWLIDTPGMRELQLTEASEGIGAVFDDLETRALGCRFSDCAHDSEPGCAIKAGLAAGEIDADRVARWRKLLREDRHNTETIAQSRERQKRFTKRVKRAVQNADSKRDSEL